MKTKLSKLAIALMMSLVLSSNLSANDVTNPCGALLCILGGQTSGECKGYYEYYIYELPKSCKGNAVCISTKQIQHLKNCKMEDGSSTGVKIDNSLATTHGVSTFTQNLDSKINQMSGVTGECTKNELNRVEKKLLRTEKIDKWSYINHYGYRINPTPTKACEVLAGQTYSAIKISYTCDKKFYEEVDWNNGFEKQLISKAEYDNLNSNDRGTYETYKDTTLSSNDDCVTLSPAQQAKYKITTYLGWDAEMNYQNVTKCKYQEIITNYYKKNYIKKDCWKVEQRVYN